MRFYGLIGKTLKHSFSKSYFESKFLKENISDCVYSNFELDDLKELKSIVGDNRLSGFNVTIPYKEAIIPFLDSLSEEAKAIGAVNCVKVQEGKLIGYNTDAFGFSSSLKPFIEPKHDKALVLGTGGASKAVAYSLKKIGIEIFFASTKVQNANSFLYKDVNEQMISAMKLIVNTTPLGMYPEVHSFPDIPYEFITSEHLCYDLIYNPEETVFLKRCKAQGAMVFNGLSMLQLQAEKSWDIWQSS
ncbi:MAG: shikimate dehydrogenase [Bacteroidia bacterium]